MLRLRREMLKNNVFEYFLFKWDMLKLQENSKKGLTINRRKNKGNI